MNTNRNPHVALEMPRQQVEDAAYWCFAKFVVAVVMALLVGFAIIPLVMPADWRTPSVHVLTRAEIQQKIDANNPIVSATKEAR